MKRKSALEELIAWSNGHRVYALTANCRRELRALMALAKAEARFQRSGGISPDAAPADKQVAACLALCRKLGLLPKPRAERGGKP